MGAGRSGWGGAVLVGGAAAAVHAVTGGAAAGAGAAAMAGGSGVGPTSATHVQARPGALQSSTYVTRCPQPTTARVRASKAWIDSAAGWQPRSKLARCTSR